MAASVSIHAPIALRRNGGPATGKATDWPASIAVLFPHKSRFCHRGGRPQTSSCGCIDVTSTQQKELLLILAGSLSLMAFVRGTILAPFMQINGAERASS